jgi:hypothetical protein
MKKPQKYELLLYNGDKNGRIENIHKWRFVVRPILSITSVHMLDENGNVVKRMYPSAKEREVALFNIQEFLFRKTSTPFAMRENCVWSVAPSLDAEDKKHIKRLYLIEEL